MTSNHQHKACNWFYLSKWVVLAVFFLFSIPSIAQDKQPINNKGKIKQMRAKSVKRKEQASTKDIAGKRLRTKNANSVAGRAIYSNPSPYANERRGKDRAAKPIGGQPVRIRSRTAETARSNVYPQKGPFVNHSSRQINTSKSRISRPRSRSTSAESSRSNVYPQRGAYVSRSPRQTERPAAKSRTRSARLSTSSARITKSYSRKPRSASQSAETSRSKRFGQGGAYVNQSSRRTENTSSGSSRFARRTKLSAGPRTSSSGVKRTVTPRSASQPFVTKGKKDVYWGKFSKGEKPFTTDISGNPLRRKNYRTPPNEIIRQKDPYAKRKRSTGDRAYSGNYPSGYKSASKTSERAWLGDISGQPIRKRSERQSEVAGQRSSKKGGGSISASGKYRSNKSLQSRGGAAISASGQFRSNQPLKKSAGSISASGRYRSNKPFQSGGGGSISASGKYQSNKPLGRGGASISATGKYRSNKPFREAGGGSISASGKYRNNQPLGRGGASISSTGKYRSNQPIRATAGSISASARYRSNKPLRGTAGSISATGDYRSNKPFRGRSGPMSISDQNRTYKFKPNGGGSISASGKYRSNQPLRATAGSISASAKYRSNKPLNVTAGSISESGKYRSNKPFKGRMGPMSISGEMARGNNKPLPAPNYGKKATRMASFQGNAKVKEPEKGGGSVSGKLWNNKEKPIETRVPKGAHASEVEGLQIAMKPKETRTKPKAVKGSLPGVPPSKSSVKASEYYKSITVGWSYERNPSSSEKSLKTIGPSGNFLSAMSYSGRMRLKKNYRHNPMSHEDALKVIAPGRAYARITDYQGNIKMSKYKDNRLMPDAKFAHIKENNVKQDRTIKTDFKLIWTKIFKKNGTQPNAVKEKSVRPRYDKRERELWPGLYD